MDSIPKNNTENLIRSDGRFFNILKKYFIFPLREGFYGFFLVFAVILFVKLLSFLLNINESFDLDFMDVMLSFVGFFFMFLIYFLKKINT